MFYSVATKIFILAFMRLAALRKVRVFFYIIHLVMNILLFIIKSPNMNLTCDLLKNRGSETVYFFVLFLVSIINSILLSWSLK